LVIFAKESLRFAAGRRNGGRIRLAEWIEYEQVEWGRERGTGVFYDLTFFLLLRRGEGLSYRARFLI
jgi:hypothetical protein